ncbi:MAG TPA: AgmX/PglI C-terminal domain-containing protein, partial [Polyangia bacterium]
LRSSPLAMVDRPWMMVLMLSLVAHLAVVVQLRRIDWPRNVEHLTEDIERVFHFRPIPSQPPVVPMGEAVVKKAFPVPSRTVVATPNEAPRTTGAERRATLVDGVRKVGLLAVLTAKSGERGGAVADLLDSGGVERSQEDALAGVNAVQLASSDSRLAVRAGQGNGKILDVHGIGQVGIGIAAAETGHREERRVVQIHTETPSIDSGSSGHLDGALLTREIRGRLGALRACYERSLKRHPELGGKLLMHLTITPAGTVASVDLSGDTLDDADLLACVRGSVLHWRFPAPETGSVEASFPLVFQAAN